MNPQKRNVMKTMNKILVMSVVALAMATVSNARADGALLSPRAAGNQIQIANLPGTNATVIAVHTIVANPGASLPPGAQGHQIVKVAGTNSDPDLVGLGLTPTEYVNMVQFGQTSAEFASPRARSTQPSVPPYEIAPVK